MITASSPSRQKTALSQGDWQRELAESYREPGPLLAALGLDLAALVAAGLAPPATATSFPMRVPRSYVARMRHGDPTDPLLRQVLPLAAETHPTAGFVADPLGESGARRAPGLLQKYAGRALLITTAACAVHCRYCFRREFPYADQVAGPRWREALAAFAADPTLEELILSGGDPLSLTNRRLAELGAGLVRVPHLKRLRLHTRTPIVLPARVDAGLAAWLAGLPWPTVMVVHANHANEIDAQVADALGRLRDAGVTLLNQSVILRGVNDDVTTLANLSGRLFEAGVLPYYLHLLDPVQGAAHFDVSENEARRIAAGLAARLPGYLVPRLVREVAGAPAKVLLPPADTADPRSAAVY